MKALLASVTEQHHFYAAPALGENFDMAPVPAAPAPTLLYSRSKFFQGVKRTNIRSNILFSSDSL
jgi:hypothetical protein